MTPTPPPPENIELCGAEYPHELGVHCTFAKGHPRLRRTKGLVPGVTSWCDHIDAKKNVEWNELAPAKTKESVLARGTEAGRDAGHSAGAAMGFYANYFKAMSEGMIQALQEAGISAVTHPTSEPDLLLDGNGVAWVRKSAGSSLWVRTSKVDNEGRIPLTRQAIEGISNGSLAEYVRRHDA